MTQPQRPLRLLLVTTDPERTTRLRSALRDGGFLVAACDGRDSLQQHLAVAGGVDLVVVSGDPGSRWVLDICRFQSGQAAGVPLLVIGSPARRQGPSEAIRAEEARVQALEAGADDVLLEPYGLPECLARCRALARRRQLSCQPSTVLSCGPVEMLVEEHEVTCNSNPVLLSPREFRLLQFLLQNQGRVWHREELLSRVWGEWEALDLDPKTVDVHIHWLRLKLEADPARPTLITTERGRGYRLG